MRGMHQVGVIDEEFPKGSFPCVGGANAGSGFVAKSLSYLDT
jgi:hypothetical protein